MLSFKDKDGKIVYIHKKLILEISECTPILWKHPGKPDPYKNVKSKIIVEYDSLVPKGYPKTTYMLKNNTTLFSSEPASDIYLK